MREQRFPPGRPPHDVLSGLKVGAMAGALLGAAVGAVTSFGSIWLMVGAAVVGGIVGYQSQARRLRGD